MVGFPSHAGLNELELMAEYVQSLLLPESYGDKQAVSDERATQLKPVGCDVSPFVG